MTKQSKAKAKGALVVALCKNYIANDGPLPSQQSPTQGREETTNGIPLAEAEPYQTLMIIFPTGFHTAPC